MSDLIAHWHNFDTDSAPFKHEADRTILDRLGPRHYCFDSVADYVQSPVFGSPGSGLHLNLLPMPYAGDLKSADIFILLLNPGFETADYVAGAPDSDLRHKCVLTIKQKVSELEFPFIFLNPAFCSSGGYRWWESKLRSVMSEYALARKIPYLDAMRQTSRRLAMIECFPYASMQQPGGLEKLPSSAKARAYVSEVLLPRARRGEISLIVTRKANAWGLSSTDDDGRNIVVYEKGETRAAHLSPNSRGGAAILQRLTS